MKTVKNINLLFAVIIFFTVSAYAQQKAGTTAMQFLKVMPCARATALGDAYSATATGAEALFWNPAGLAWIDNQEVSITYINWIFDARLYALGYALSLGDIGSVGALFQYVDYGAFDEAIVSGQMYFPGQTLPYITGRTFKPYDYVIGLSYAKKMTDKFSFGLTAKYAYESLAGGGSITTYSTDDNGSIKNTYSVESDTKVLLFDAGFKYNTGFRTIQIAASAQNFGPDVKYKSNAKETHYPAPLLFRLGAAADVIGKNSLLLNVENHRIGVLFDLFLANDASQQEHLGVEYEFSNMLALRAGYKFNYGMEGFTCGGGVRQNIGNLKFSIDYSYGKMDALISDYTNNSHRISVGVGIQ